MANVQAADEAILVLVPMLLLLNQDPLVFSGLTERRRYAPLVLVLTICLVFSAVSGALQGVSAGAMRSPFVMEQRQASGAWLLAKNLALLAVAAPIHVLFLRVCMHPHAPNAPPVSFTVVRLLRSGPSLSL